MTPSQRTCVDRMRSPGVAGLTGQALNFVAMLAPAVLAHRAALIDLVIVASFANAFALTAVLAAPAFYPGVPDERTANGVLKCSVVTLVVTPVAGAAAAVLVPGLDTHVRWLAVGVAALVLCQGFDLIAVAIFVRVAETRAIMHNRFRYGVVNVVLTLAACAASSVQWALVVSTCLVYVVTFAWLAVTHRALLHDHATRAGKARFADARPAVRAAVVAAGSYLVYGFGLQAAAIGLADAGRLTAAWSVVMRVAGGFGTVGMQLVAPEFDATFSRMLRAGDVAGARHRITAAMRTGVVLAVVGVGAALGVAALTGATGHLAAHESVLLTVSAVAFWFPSLATVVVFKALTLTGRSGTRFAWDAARFAALVAVVVLLTGPARLVAVAVVVGAFGVLLVPLAFTSARPIRARAPATVLPR